MPKIYGDRLMPMLVKMDRELQVMEIEFIEMEDVSSEDDDVINYGEIQKRAREIYEDLKKDRIRGETAVQRLNVQVFDPFDDLIMRMVESKGFPELFSLYELARGGV